MDENKPPLPKFDNSQFVIDKLLEKPIQLPKDIMSKTFHSTNSNVYDSLPNRDFVEQVRKDIVANNAKKERRDKVMLYSTVAAAVFSLLSLIISLCK